jgi:ribosomal 50S subunit-associated protein YjgA (DUF615 family)
MNTKVEQSRVTIDMPIESHKRLKAMAAILGKSMREIIIELIDKNLCSKSNILNKRTVKTIKNIEKKRGLVKAKNAVSLFKKLGI